jgi:plasmid stabilization system protein ParE
MKIFRSEKAHLIFYVVERNRIVVVRIIDGRMDIDEEFKR